MQWQTHERIKEKICRQTFLEAVARAEKSRIIGVEKERMREKRYKLEREEFLVNNPKEAKNQEVALAEAEQKRKEKLEEDQKTRSAAARERRRIASIESRHFEKSLSSNK